MVENTPVVPMWKVFLINVAKNAVNAGILSLGAVYHNPSQYNYVTAIGIWSIAKFIVIPAVLAREGLVYVPKILKWSQTDTEATGG